MPLALPVLKTPRFHGTGRASGTQIFHKDHFFNGLLGRLSVAVQIAIRCAASLTEQFVRSAALTLVTGFEQLGYIGPISSTAWFTIMAYKAHLESTSIRISAIAITDPANRPASDSSFQFFN